MAETAVGAATSRIGRGCSFGLLGPLVVLCDGRAVAMGGRQQKAVLARLLVDPGATVSVDRLVQALWGDSPSDGAVTTVQTYVSHLRDALEPDRPRGTASTLLLTEARGYRLAVDESDVDSAVFERRVSAGRSALARGELDDAANELSDALGLWRGEVLSDLADYDFTREAAARLEGLRLSALEDRLDADLALGRHRLVADELESLAAAHPLRERLHGQRMLALYRSGRQAEALAVYESLRDALAGELGIDPNPDLADLHLAILRQDHALDGPESVSVLPAASSRAPPALGEGAPPRSEPGSRRRVDPRRIVVSVALVAIIALLGASAVLSSGSDHMRSLVLAANSVGRLDSGSGLGATVQVGQSPAGMAYGAGSLWVANEGAGTVSEVDPRTSRVVQTIDVGSAPTAVAVTGDDVWVVNGGDATVSRVNARTDREVQKVDVGNSPSAVAAGAGGIWVANTADDTVQRIDQQSGRPARPIDVGTRPSGVAVSAGTVWVSNAGDGTVSRVDAASGESESPISVGAGPRGLVVNRGTVWVADSLELNVTRINAVSGAVEQVVRVGDGPRSVVSSGGAVWVADEYDGTLQRIDPTTNKVTRRLRLGASLRGLATSGSSVWVAAGSASSGASSSAHRGGTLRVEAWPVPGFETIDPARNWLTWPMFMAYDGLVALRRTGGPDGTTLVPDLADALPRPTDGGRTYTFNLRRGIRYANGRTVVPSDLRRGLRRAALGPGQDYYSGIIGVHQCSMHPSDCDLSRGVVTDDARGRITFHLRSADPDFLGKLSVFVFATPPGVPDRDAQVPIPGTGPYEIVGWRPANQKTLFTMVRNPYFRQWSFAAKPDGYPDQVVWRRQESKNAEVTDLLSGRADISDPFTVSFPTPVMTRLSRQHPAAVHSDPSTGSYFEWLNTRVRPFDDVRARRAFNLAVDRDQLVRLYGGSTKVVASCQILPPNFTGYRPYCPYTSSPRADGSYHGPDLRAARALVRASRTTGAVVLVPTTDPEELPVNRYLARVLRSIGYRAAVDVRDPRSGEPGRRDQLGGSWWGVDFASPSNLWAPLLSCPVGPPRTGDSRSVGGFCDRGVDRLARRALAAQVTDPSSARHLWATVDRRLTDAAPWVAGPVTRFTTVVARRVGNYQANPVVGPLLDQMWVR